MKILVTGGVGKVGQWVVRKLLDSPAHEVTVFDRVPGPERGAVKYLVGDVQDLGQVMEAIYGARGWSFISRRFIIPTSPLPV